MLTEKHVYLINDIVDMVGELKPKVLVPMHYRIRGLSLSIKPLQEFLDHITPSVINRIGNEIEIIPEDIADIGFETWVFSF